MSIKLLSPCFLFIILSLSCNYNLLADEEFVDCKKPPKGATRSIAALDNFHTWCTKGILKFANKIDYFFGGIRVDEESNETYGRVSFETRFREGESVKFSTRQRIHLNLPRTEKKIKLIFNKEGNDKEEGDFIRPSPPGQENERGFDTALRYTVEGKPDGINLH